MMDRLIRSGRVLWRAEAIIAEIQLQQLIVRSGLVAAAALVAAFGLFMLNVAGFFVMEPVVGSAAAAALMAAFDFCVVAVLLIAAIRKRPSRELGVAVELRQLALNELEADTRHLQEDFEKLRAEVVRTRDVVLGLLRNPLDAAVSNLIAPLAGIVIRSLKKSEKPS